MYNDNFYDVNKNVFLFQSAPTKYHYFPMINYLQEEFAPLWDNNGINMILHHETLVKRRYLSAYKKSNIRKFILGRGDNLTTTGSDTTYVYDYTNTYTKDTFKIQSYLNDHNQYKIHEIVEISASQSIFADVNDVYGYTVDESQFEVPKLTVETPVTIPSDILDILKGFKTLSIKEINEILEDIDIDYTLNYLYYTPVLLIILDLFLDGVLHSEKRNQFY